MKSHSKKSVETIIFSCNYTLCIVLQSGVEVYSDNCNQLCTCSQGSYNCVATSCGEGEICGVNPTSKRYECYREQTGTYYEIIK